MAKKPESLRVRFRNYQYERRIASERQRAEAEARRLERVHERRERLGRLHKKLNISDNMEKDAARLEKQSLRRERLHEFQSKLDASPRLRTALALLAVTLFAALTGLLYRYFSFHGLDSEGMDNAQLARNIAAGQSFSTNFIRPFALPLAPNHLPAPDFFNAPLYPFALAAALPFLGESDNAVSTLSLAIYVGCAVLLFRLAQRLSGGNRWTAALTVVAFALSEPVLGAAMGGTSLVLSAFLLLALMLLLTPRHAEERLAQVQTRILETAARDAPLPAPEVLTRGLVRQYFFVGVLSGLCYLTQYVSLLYVLPLVVLWGSALRRWRRATVLGFVLGFVLVALPWWVRNIRLTGNPLYSLQWLELAMGTDTFPGSSLMRDLSKGLASTGLVAPGLDSFVTKMLRGLLGYFSAAPSVPHMALAPFIFIAFWLPDSSRLAALCKAGMSGALVFTIVGLSALGRVSPMQLVPLAGLLAFIGVSTCQKLSGEWMERWKLERIAREAHLKPLKVFLVNVWFMLGLGVVFLLPLAVQLRAGAISSSKADEARAAEKEKLVEMGKALPEKRLIVTDIPWAVAWYAKRPAIWLPKEVPQMDTLEKTLKAGAAGSVSAVYLSSALLLPQSEDAGSDWQRAVQQVADLRGYQKLPLRTGDILYRRLPSLGESQTLVKTQPESAEAYLSLGRAHLDAGRARPALDAFQKAIALRPKAAVLHQEAGIACLQLEAYDKARTYFQQALRLSPQLLNAQMGLAETYRVQKQTPKAIEVYERVLADYPNQRVAMNNLAYLYAETSANRLRGLEMARRALALNPGDGAVRDTVGWMCYRNRRFAEAIAHLRLATRLLPDRGLYYLHLGQALLAAGQRDEAGRALLKARSLRLTPEEKREAEAALSQTLPSAP
jgi:tetratricopeptide (TPR) repeat protein